MIEQTDKNVLDSPVSRSGWMNRLGIILILLSGVFFFSMFAVPWVPVSSGQKVFLAGGLFVGVQIAWWSGAALSGPAVVGVIRGWFKGSAKREP